MNFHHASEFVAQRGRPANSPEPLQPTRTVTCPGARGPLRSREQAGECGECDGCLRARAAPGRGEHRRRTRHTPWAATAGHGVFRHHADGHCRGGRRTISWRGLARRARARQRAPVRQGQEQWHPTQCMVAGAGVRGRGRQSQAEDRRRGHCHLHRFRPPKERRLHGAHPRGHDARCSSRTTQTSWT